MSGGDLVWLLLGLCTVDAFEGIYFFEVTHPPKLKYTYEVRLARDFGQDFGRLFKEVEMVAAEPANACESLANTARGRVVLAERGGCSFVSKALAAEAAGAVATVVTDSEKADDAMVEMIKDETDRQTSIPAVYLPGNHGQIFQTHFRYSVERVFINIPLNLSLVPLDKVRKPPWDLW